MSIFDELKSVGKVLQEAGKIEQYQQILDTQEKLLEMQKKIFDLEKEKQGLVEKLKLKSQLNFERNAYWVIDGDVKDGPFCSCCWDDQNKTIRMQPCGNPAYFNCPKCKNKDVEIYPERSIQQSQSSVRDSYM